MRILHLSDLHYGKKYINDIERMFLPFIETISKINNENKIDLIVFTGDLVWSGNNSQNFQDILNNFIEPILEKLDLDKNDFIICAGNHDMSGQKELQAITNYIDTFSTNDELDQFVKDNDQQFDLSYEKSKNYYDFITNFYPEDKSNIEQLYQTFQRTINKNDIGIVSFHTAWRSFIGEHSGRLLLPKKTIYDALKTIPKKKLYISLMHHPISDLKIFNSFEIEDIIYEKFHINFSGHYHKKKQGIMFTHDIGILSISAMATMSGYDKSSIGFSLVDINIDTLDINLVNYCYNSGDNIFVETSNNNLFLPMNIEKSEQVKILKKIKEMYAAEIIESTSLLINHDDIEEKTFIDYFNDPVLKEKSYYESIETANNLKNISVNQLINENFIIYGKDKFGKTSILKMLQINLLENFKEKKTIPFYYDLKNIKGNVSLTLQTEISRRFSINKKLSLKLIEENKIQFLFDNFNQEKSAHIEVINKFAEEATDFFIILASEEIQKYLSQNIEINNHSLKKLFIHPITRKNIRTQTTKMLQDYNIAEKNEIIQKVLSIFNQMNIPFNYWYLSLFLWIYRKQKNISINDNVEMLILYIDKLLEREQIAKYNKNISYDLFKKLLGELSHTLLTEYKDADYSMTYFELVFFVDDFKNKNIRFVTDEKEIIDYILDKGIIKINYPSGRYTFRLNGVMEYFTAEYMTTDQKFSDTILNDNEYYLEFANEIEIFAGLDRKNIDLLTKLHNKTELVLKATNDKYNKFPDENLKYHLEHISELAVSIKSINIDNQLPLEIDEQDEILDDLEPIQNFNEDVKLKKPKKSNKEYSLVQLEKHIFILARAFRSLSLITDSNILDKTFNLILTSYINIGFEILAKMTHLKKKSKKEIEKKIIDLLTSFIPLMTQLNLSEALLHKDLKRYFEQEIDKLEHDMEKNQFRLMILYFMILDMDLKENYLLIDKIISNIKLPPLSNVIFIKLLYYLIFKSNKNKSLENYLKNKIIELQMDLDPKQNKSKLINKIEKKMLLKGT